MTVIVAGGIRAVGGVDVEEWFVPEGDHMEASLRLFEGDTALLYGRKSPEGLFRLLDVDSRRKESGRTCSTPCRNSSLRARCRSR